MNKINIRCQKEGNAKFFYASRKMTLESKTVKVFIFLLSLVPIVLSLAPIPGNQETLIFAFTMVSFGMTLLIEFMSSFVSTHKEKSVMLHQLYEVSITDSFFSKIEYDREMTNELNELAIRKAAPKMNKLSVYHKEEVSQEIDDKYGYLYIVRKNAAKMNYLLSRMYAIYIFWLAIVLAAFISLSFFKNDTKEFFQLIIQFYPLVLPIVKNINASRKTMRHCAKISADIDNFFADGDDSLMRRSRFIYYVQNIEYESYMDSPVRYAIFYKLFRRGLRNLEKGVTKRFIEAQRELTIKSSSAKQKLYREVLEEKTRLEAKDEEEKILASMKRIEKEAKKAEMLKQKELEKKQKIAAKKEEPAKKETKKTEKSVKEKSKKENKTPVKKEKTKEAKLSTKKDEKSKKVEPKKAKAEPKKETKKVETKKTEPKKTETKKTIKKK